MLTMVFKFLKARHLTEHPQYFTNGFSFNFIIPSLLFLFSNNTIVVNSLSIHDFTNVSSIKYRSYLFDDEYNNRLMGCFGLNSKGKSLYTGAGIGIHILMEYDIEKLQYEKFYLDFSEIVLFTKRQKHPDAFYGFDLADLVTEIGDKIARTTKKSFRRTKLNS